MIAAAHKIEDVKPGMIREDVLKIAGKPVNIYFIGTDKSTTDSLFSYQYNEKQFIYILGNKEESIDLDINLTKLQLDSLIKRREQK